jgi:S-adenosylmethionine-diacylgycerolhomoserine-N-methlytransferase
MNAAHAHIARLERYYRFHASIYDATRWSFLFGRRRLIKSLPDLPLHPRILDVGCGTGKTMALIHGHYPTAQITGMDISAAMLMKARKKLGHHSTVQFIRGAYGEKDFPLASYDLILCSYSLGMMGPKTELVINKTKEDLSPDGIFAAVDFDDTPCKHFNRWMQINHATVDGSILPALKNTYTPINASTQKAYGGLWLYFKFVGRQV